MTEVVPDDRIMIFDIEVYWNFFMLNVRRLSDRKELTFILVPGGSIDRERIRRLMFQYTWVGFNSMSYDMPLLWAMLDGADNSELKILSDRIIHERIKWWDIGKYLNISIPTGVDHIDLIEPNPAVMQGLKMLNGRLHGRRLQDLPFDPSLLLSEDQIRELIRYCWNDIDATELLYLALKEPLELRIALGKEYGMDLRSKSDAQMGEAIFKERVRRATGRRVGRANPNKKIEPFTYVPPSWLKFETPYLQNVLDIVKNTTFKMSAKGKTELPKAIEALNIEIGRSTYTLRLGGLHSTEEKRALLSDDEWVLADADVASQYPSILAMLGLYPETIGPAFCTEYRSMIVERLAAKKAKLKAKSEGLKIALNGGVYGKLGSAYSALFSPKMLIATTMTGQLSLLMLVERAEMEGISVVSGNTDGVVFYCRREHCQEIKDDRILAGKLKDIIEKWEHDTGFVMEVTEYESLYTANVNTYIAFKPDGKVKRKGPLADYWSEKDYRNMMTHNPQMVVCSNAVVAFLKDGTPIEKTIRDTSDVKQFIRVINTKGGSTWRDGYLGKVARYYWSVDGEPILYKEPHPTTGNYKKVSKTDGARPMMDLVDELPSNVDYERYIQESYKILSDIGYMQRTAIPPELLLMH